jgi:hypothetical protein
VYARRIGDEVLDFGHRGWLFDSSFLFYDYKTDSLWVQATGAAIHGPYKDRRLTRLPATQTTWSEWYALHPETLVLGRTSKKSPDYWQDSYARYYATGESVVKKHAQGPLTFGLAVILPEAQKIYPFRELEKKPVVSDRLAGRDTVIVFHAPSRTALAFDPHHDGKRLEFLEPKTGKTAVILTDRQTGSRWSGLTGMCLDGPCKGSRLLQLPATQFVMENWSLHYPGAPVYHAP